MEEKVRQQKRVELKGLTKLALASLLGGLVATSSLNLSWHNGAAHFTEEAQATSHQSEAQSPQGLPDFVSLAKRLTPVVVNISTTQSSGGGQQIFPSPFGEQDPFSEFWKRFFGDPPPREESSRPRLSDVMQKRISLSSKLKLIMIFRRRRWETRIGLR
jgi:hypothetical protein